MNKEIIRQNDKVVLVKMPNRTISRLKMGMIGKVVKTRPFIDNHLLIKWIGKSELVSHNPNNVKKYE